MKSADIIIIGGGIVGCSTAFHLSQHGKSVILLEKGRVGRQASGVNAGGVRQLWRDVYEIPLSLASHKLWHRIESIVDDDCGFRPTGQISLAENEKEMTSFQERVDLLKSLGYSHEELVDQAQVRKIVPAVSSHCIGGLYCKDDGVAEPYRATRAFYNKAKELGAELIENCPVKMIERTVGKWLVYSDHGRFESPVLINCAGAWGGQISEMLGETVPLCPQASVLTVTARVTNFLTPVVLLESRKLSFKQMLNGTIVIGGGFLAKLNMETEKASIDLSELKTMAKTVTDLFPFLSHVPIVRWWPGIMAMMPDHIPVIGPSKNNKDVYHAFGFSGHGFQLGPIIGKIMSELVMDGKSSLPIDPFLIDRFTITNQ